MSFLVQALIHTSRALLICHGIILLWSTIVTIHCNGSMLCVYGDGLLPLVQLPSDVRNGADAILRPHVLLNVTVLLLSCAPAFACTMFALVVASFASPTDIFRRQLGRACATALIVALAFEIVHTIIVIAHAGFTSDAAAETRQYMVQHDVPFVVSFFAAIILLLAVPNLRQAPVEASPQRSLIWRPVKALLGVEAAAMVILAVLTFCMPIEAIDVIRNAVGDGSESMRDIFIRGNVHPFAFVSLSAPLEVAMSSCIVTVLIFFAIRSNSDLLAACCLVCNSLFWAGALFALALRDVSLMRDETNQVGIDPHELHRWIIALFVVTVVAFLLHGYVMRCAWLQHRAQQTRRDTNNDVSMMERDEEIDSEHTESSARSVSDSDSVSAGRAIPARQQLSNNVDAQRMYINDQYEDDDDDEDSEDSIDDEDIVQQPIPARQVINTL
jgi:hypothetical protein